MTENGGTRIEDRASDSGPQMPQIHRILHLCHLRNLRTNCGIAGFAILSLKAW